MAVRGPLTNDAIKWTTDGQAQVCICVCYATASAGLVGRANKSTHK